MRTNVSRAFFRRFGVQEVEYRLREVAWPAPRRIGVADLAQPRVVLLYVLRRASQGISALSGAHLCNRYFYAGRQSVEGSGFRVQAGPDELGSAQRAPELLNPKPSTLS